MKKCIALFACTLGLLISPQLFAQEGIGTNLPDKSAALEIRSNQRGLLIPRLEVDDLNDEGPVTNPANSLLIYNTSAGNEGFYYWKTDNGQDHGSGHWEPLESTITGGGETVVEAGDLIDVAFDNNDTYTVSVEGGNEGQVLVTDENGSPTWIDADQVFNVQVGNGLTITQDGKIQLGGTLTKPMTTIDANGNNFAIANLPDANNLTDQKVMLVDANDGTLRLIDPSELGGESVESHNLELGDNLEFLGANLGVDAVLQETKIGIKPSDNENDVLTTIADGSGGLTVEWANPADINPVEADVGNGLHTQDEEIRLGGELSQAETTIETNDQNTLAITGLQEASEGNSLLVTEDDGILRTITRSIFTNSGSDYGDFSSWTEYNPYVQEVNIEVDVSALSGNDVNLNLPDAVEAEGQVINIKLTDNNGNGEASNYLNIKESNTIITYGALPYQAWVLKSNGSDWRIVGKN